MATEETARNRLMTCEQATPSAPPTTSTSRWRPKALPGSSLFPSADQLVFDEMFTNYRALLPAPLLPLPALAHGKGHRVRKRVQDLRILISSANNFLAALNTLDAGFRSNKRTSSRGNEPSRGSGGSSQLTNATKKLHRRVLKIATQVVSVRRRSQLVGCTGAQITSSFTKAEITDSYTTARSTHAQVPMRANAMVEPLAGSPFVDMLAALPARER